MNLLFSGCSFTKGAGLDLLSEDQSNYCNVFSKIAFRDTQPSINNIGVSGYSNLRIFLDTCEHIISGQYDYAFVGWTSYPRHVLWAGLEEYETKRSLIPGMDNEPHNGNDLSFSASFLGDLRDKFSLISNAHYDILDIVRYINVLMALGSLKNTKIYFLNNNCKWDDGFFNRTQTPLPSELTPYTNELLNSDNRDDRQISVLYNKMHDGYESLGGIRESHWLNLYTSMQDMKTDLGSDNLHPGKLSHQHYGTFLAQRFISL